MAQGIADGAPEMVQSVATCVIALMNHKKNLQALLLHLSIPELLRLLSQLSVPGHHIVNASDADFNKLQSSIYSCDGAAAQMAETMNDNLQGQITIPRASIAA